MANERPSGTVLPPLRVSLLRMALRLVLVFGVAWAVYEGAMWAIETSQAVLPEAQAGMIKWGLLGVLLVTYVALMAVPFVPGIEIGVSLLLIGGAAAAPIVYLATVLGLSLAFWIGAALPHSMQHRFFADLRLKRVCNLLSDLQPLSRQDRLDLLSRKFPRAMGPLMLKGRYLGLAVLLNLPGNVVLGGGGGISLIAGASKLFAPAWTLLVIALAVLPVPLAVWLWGTGILQSI